MVISKTVTVNGERMTTAVDDPEMPLLYLLRGNHRPAGPRFGCGLAQCGACTVHVDGKAVRSCVTPLSSISEANKVVTLEGLGTQENLHPLQRAFIQEQAPGAMRLLHQRHDHGGGRFPHRKPKARRSRHQECHSSRASTRPPSGASPVP